MSCLKNPEPFLSVFFYLFGICYLNELRIKEGKIIGSSFQGINNRTLWAYRGVPFGEKPIRFKYSVPEKPWKGVLNATQEGPMCVQRNFGNSSKVTGQEDCLNLSVYTACSPKKCQYEEKLPVMVFFPGGAWVIESNSLSESNVQYLLTKKVVLVNCNYRVDAFGWLSTEDEASPGNYGLYDQYLALKWVNENIEYFGGDPNQVTIIGGSAGGASVNFLCFSHLTKGLFHRMISQSGTVFIPLGRPYSPSQVAKELAEACGCPTYPSSVMVKCLTNVPADEIIQKQAQLYGVKDGYPPFANKVWSPVFSRPFFTCNPRNGSCECSNQWINGFVLVDGNYFSNLVYRFPNFEALVDKHPYPYLSTYMGLEYVFPCRKTFPAIIDKILHFYFNGQLISRKMVHAFNDMFTDYGFYWPSLRTTFNHSGPVYYYRYDYILDAITGTNLDVNGSHSILKLGPGHGDDCLTLLGGKDSRRSHKDLEVTKYHVALWVNFATTGDPTRGLQNVKWDLAGTKTNFKYLVFGKEPVPALKEGLPYPERYAFWESLLRLYGGHCKKEGGYF